MRKQLIISTFAFVSLTWAMALFGAGLLFESAKLVPPGGRAYELVGRSVCHSGPTAVIGSDFAAYVFRRIGSDWVYETQLVPPDGVDYYGSQSRVAVLNDLAAFARNDARYFAPYPNAVYLFQYVGSQWAPVQIIGREDPTVGLSMSEDLLVIGSPRFSVGYASVFRRSGMSWTLEQNLSAPDAVGINQFGVSVHVRGDTIAVGAIHDSPRAFHSGSVYIFRWDGVAWVEHQKLYPSDGDNEAEFGTSVWIGEDVIVAGAAGDSEHGYLAGAAYVFRLNGSLWVEKEKLVAPDATELDLFGSSVVAMGDIIAIGAPERNGVFADENAFVDVFIRHGSSWEYARRLHTSNPTGGLGQAIFTDGEVLSVGAPGDMANGSAAGAAFIYDRIACQPGFFGADCLECPGGTDHPCNGSGICDDDLDGGGQCACYPGFVGMECENCAAGFFGPNCAECPGGAANSCSGNGICMDGIDGSGECQCNLGFAGTACDDCVEGHFGISCEICPGGVPNACSGHGSCDDGSAGTGACDCDSGYAGADCSLQAIPAISTWGLCILALLLMIGIKLPSRRPALVV